jgi:hypothetical protein
MGEDHGGCVSRQGSLYDLPRMHACAIDRAPKQLLKCDQLVSGIKVHAAPSTLVVWNLTIMQRSTGSGIDPLICQPKTA